MKHLGDRNSQRMIPGVVVRSLYCRISNRAWLLIQRQMSHLTFGFNPWGLFNCSRWILMLNMMEWKRMKCIGIISINYQSVLVLAKSLNHPFVCHNFSSIQKGGQIGWVCIKRWGAYTVTHCCSCHLAYLDSPTLMDATDPANMIPKLLSSKRNFYLCFLEYFYVWSSQILERNHNQKITLRLVKMLPNKRRLYCVNF